MSKTRTTIALSEDVHAWLRKEAGSYGRMTEYIEQLVRDERELKSTRYQLTRQADRLERLLTALEAAAHA